MIGDGQTIIHLLLLLAGLVIGYLAASKLASIRLQNMDALWRARIDDVVARKIRERETELRREAAQRSGKALSGRVLERFAPLMDRFPFDPHDAVWIGSPVDFIVFDGISQDWEGLSSLKQIVFVEVKSGSGQLSKRQRRIREIVERRRVSWEEVRIPH